MRPRLARLVSLWRKQAPPDPPRTEDQAAGRGESDRRESDRQESDRRESDRRESDRRESDRRESDRRLADAQRRLKQAVPAKEE